MTRKHHKLRSEFYLFSIIVVVTIALTGCFGSSSGGSIAESAIPLTINGSVYDSEIAGATVDLVVGGAVVATTTADNNGKYTISLDTTSAQRSKTAVIRAHRGSIMLQSLVGILQTVVDASDSSHTVSQSTYPLVMVTNATTALTSVIQQQNGGTFPDSQAGIDNLVNTIANDPTMRALVTKIAAGIKAVVDYEADPTSVSGTVNDTQALADYLANNSSNIDTDLDSLVATASSSVTATDLINVVQSDPNTGEQLPYTFSASDLIGKYYVFWNNTMLYFQDSSTVIAYEYANVVAGTSQVTTSWSLSDNTITIPIPGGNDSLVMNIVGGTPDAINTTIGPDSALLRRVEPIGGGNIGESDITNKFLVDPQMHPASAPEQPANAAIMFPANCNGTDTGWVYYNDVVMPATCTIGTGMAIISPDWAAVSLPDGGSIVVGLLSDAWNGSTITQSFNSVIWLRDNSATFYDKLYAGTDSGSNPCINCPSGTNSHPIAVRIYPDRKVDLRLLKKDYTDVSNPGESVIYASDNTAPKEKYFAPAQNVANWPNLVSLSANDLAGTSGSRLIVNLGKHAGSNLRAVYTVDNLTNNTPMSMVTRNQYNLQEFSVSDVSGKTFSFTDMIDTSASGTITFNTDGTANVIFAGGENGTLQWSIGPDALTNAAYGSTGITYNKALVLSDPASGVSYIFYRTKDLGGGTYITGNYTVDSLGNIAGVALDQLTVQ